MLKLGHEYECVIIFSITAEPAACVIHKDNKSVIEIHLQSLSFLSLLNFLSSGPT